tara:strand:+ start:3142 stop:4152 length:1011 start_codon:yes stop_codon:yes gene_type:complete
MSKKRIVVICPGRGSYTRETNNYFKQFGELAKKEIKWMDEQREGKGRLSLTKLDSQNFRARTHMIGENASTLIYACSLIDFLSIDKNKYEVVSILGNSMGWYTALALSQTISIENGFDLIDTMGSMMKDNLIGAQMIYPITKDNWQKDQKALEVVLSEVHQAGAHISIELGGYVVIGGERSTLQKLSKKLPVKEKYPLIIPYHAAFHTPLLESISRSAFKMIDSSIFKKPSIPLIDGRGKIWSPYSSDPIDIMEYTLDHQVQNTFDFTSSVMVALKEYSPDKVLLLGPGNSLGGPVGQILIEHKWLGLESKEDFSNYQKVDPFVLSMGIIDQRKML